MAIIFIILTVLISVGVFFFLATKFGSSKDKISEILDGDATSRSSQKEPESLSLDPDRTLNKEERYNDNDLYV